MNFSIISNNCWSQDLHIDLNIPYTTPFVDILIFEDYIEIVRNIDNIDFNNIKLLNENESKFFNRLPKTRSYAVPGVLLDDSFEINPIHVKSWDEFQSKWLRRSKRLNFDNLIVKISQRDGITREDIAYLANDFINNKCNFHKLIVYGDYLLKSKFNSNNFDKKLLIIDSNKIDDTGQLDDDYTQKELIKKFILNE